MMNASQKLIRAIRNHFSERDRGAAVVETAIAIPILLLVIMGSIEAGLAWEAKSASTSGVRTGTLRAASIGDRPETDMRILQSIVGEVGTDNVNRVEWVVVFEASAVDKDATIAACASTGAGECVRYDTALIAGVADSTVQLADFDTGGGSQTDGSYICDGTKVDGNWCAGKRSEFDQDVQVGVAIRYNHDWFTGIFPFDAPSYTDFSVSSTFLSGGESVTGTVSIPSGIGSVATSGFNPGIDPSDGPITWSVDESEIDGTHGFLGEFGLGDAPVTAVVETPVPHDQVCVTFTLYVIDSWDSEDFTFTLGGVTHTYTYQHTGSVSSSPYGSSTWPDQVHTITECVPHTSTSNVTMSFDSDLSAGIGDESWAIDDVTVTVQNT